MILGYQGFSGHQAIGTPSGGGVFPAPGREFVNSGFASIEDSDDAPAGPRGTYGQGGVVSPPGPGAGWNGVLQGLAGAAGTLLINRLFGDSDSRSTKASAVPSTPTSSGAKPSPGHASEGDKKSPARRSSEPEKAATVAGFTFSPLHLAAAAGLVAVLLIVRR